MVVSSSTTTLKKMKPTSRQLRKWRKKKPMKHRSFGEKRNRSLAKVDWFPYNINITENPWWFC